VSGPEPRLVTTPPDGVDLARMADYFVPMMMRNIATDGYPFVAPTVFPAERQDGQPQLPPEAVLSQPGCILASPTYHENLPTVKQNYVYNWVRDAAIVAMELAAADLPALPGGISDVFDDYVAFAATCWSKAPTELDRAKYTIAGDLVENWPRQNDGPALQTLALLSLFPKFSAPAQDTARQLITANIGFVVDQHQHPNNNLWEEVYGQSFFTRSVQLKCLNAVREDAWGATVPAGIDAAADWLADALQEHAQNGSYRSILDATNPRDGYDPNSDIVLACVYGVVESTDPVLLNTAAALFTQCTDPVTGYHINSDDAELGIGPLLGRYPGDYYDGTHVSATEEGATRGHPWAVCTAGHAELYYRVARVVLDDGRVPDDPLAGNFLTQAGTSSQDDPGTAAAALYRAGDRMLQAIVYHSDHLELGEQFNAVTGYENSVRNLSWSYASFLSALRSRAGLPTPPPA
jgi:glucoamylase